MYLLRRTALRAISKPSTSLFIKPRSITTVAPTAWRPQQQWARSPLLQRRAYSDETTKTEEELAKPEEVEIKEAESTSAPIESAAEQTETINSESNEDQSAVNSAVAAAAGAAASSPAVELDPKCSLYVGNLFFEVNEKQLEQVFSKYGSVKSVNIVYDNRGLSRGFGFVTMESPEEAQRAIENLHQQTLEGRRLVCQIHVPRQRNNRIDLTSPVKANPPSKTLFIGNMSFEMSDRDLNDLFREVRNVLDVRVAIDRRTGQPRGFAHADFIDVASAERAKKLLENKEIYGRKLRVDFSGHSSASQSAPAAQ